MKNYDDVSKAGYLIIIGASQFLIFWKVAEFLRPEYSVSQDVISALGVGENAFIFNASVMILGLLGILASYYILKYDKVLAVLLALSSIGAVGVGLFPMDNPLPHFISALLAFLFAGLATLYSARLDKSMLRILWVILGITSLSALMLFITDNYLGLGRGGMERLIVYPPLIWLLVFGRGLIEEK